MEVVKKIEEKYKKIEEPYEWQKNMQMKFGKYFRRVLKYLTN